jgi:hypothetical protein
MGDQSLSETEMASNIVAFQVAIKKCVQRCVYVCVCVWMCKQLHRSTTASFLCAFKHSGLMWHCLSAYSRHL